MSTKLSFSQKIKNIFSKKSSRCICQELSPGKWYCHTWDGGKLVQCAGNGPYNSKAECEQAKCQG